MLAPIGLTQAEALARLARDGGNELPTSRGASLLRRAGEVIREPMFAMLIGAGMLYAFIGDLAEALLLLLFATLSVSIAIVQRRRSDRVLDALREMTSPRALVVRDGIRQRIAGREVVRGDLLVVGEGDRVAADAVLILGTDVRVSESMLTGESVPVRKQAAVTLPVAISPPGGEDSPLLFAGTMLVSGTGLAQVLATGPRSQIGRLGLSVRDIEPEVPRLQAQTRRLVVGFALVGAALSALAVLLFGLVRGDWVQALLGGIALGMSMLPEEFPLVLTVFTVMGAWRLSRSRVLTRNAAAIETLGAATVLCTDKTGTLTQNAMNVVWLETQDAEWQVGEEETNIAASATLRSLLATAALACEPQGLDPMDQALAGLARGTPSTGELEHIHTYPLRREMLAVAHVWQAAGSTHRQIAAKGAPEAIAVMCHMDQSARDAMIRRVDALAQAGMRVLAVAQGTLAETVPELATDLSLKFIGLVGFADPLREDVAAAVGECREAGVHVVMITGDYPQTAIAIARQAGLQNGSCISGAELDAMTDETLGPRLRDVTVFARTTPQQKLRIVNAFKAYGEIVAMTGDGVNDAPALKSAHIGIAMGRRGTDVAREAASLVLLDDDFGSIVQAIRLGRRIYDNLRKAFSYILAVHVPIAGLALLPVLFGAPLVLTPMLIALLELIIDPACSVVLEAEHSESDMMRRAPRDQHASLVSRSLAAWSLAQGLLAFVLVAAIYWDASQRSLTSPQLRLTVFLALISTNLALLFSNRRRGASLRSILGRDNPSLRWGFVATVGVLSMLIGWPMLRVFFDIAVPGVREFAMALGAGVVLLAVLQLCKRNFEELA